MYPRAQTRRNLGYRWILLNAGERWLMLCAVHKGGTKKSLLQGENDRVFATDFISALILFPGVYECFLNCDESC